MSYSAVIDICLHFHSFRNIDLFHQGLYNLRARVYQDLDDKSNANTASNVQSAKAVNVTATSDKCVAAYPYVVLPAHFEDSDFIPSHIPLGSSHGRPEVNRGFSPCGLKGDKPDHHRVYPAEINDESQTFRSRTFLIRYCDEEPFWSLACGQIELNEMCQFRFEADLCQRNALNAPVYLEVDLMFADPSTHNNMALIKERGNMKKAKEISGDTGIVADSSGNSVGGTTDDLFTSRIGEIHKQRTSAADVSMKNSESFKMTEFISVSYEVYRLSNVSSGIHEYIPIIFDEFHYSLCSMTVHSMIQDIRCRLRPNSFPCAYQPRHRLRKPPPTLTYGQNRSDGNLTTSDYNKEQSTFSSHGSTGSSSERAQPPPPVQSVSYFLKHGHQALGARGAGIVKISAPRQQQTYQIDSKDNKDKKLLSETSCAKPTNNTLMFASTTSTSLMTTSSAPSLQSPLIHRADLLHSEGLSIKQRVLLSSRLCIKPIELPGGAIVTLPGSSNQLETLEPYASHDNCAELSSRSMCTSSVGSSGDINTNELPDMPFPITAPKGSGNSYYASDDLMTVTFHLSSEAIEDEVNRLEEEREITASLNENERPKITRRSPNTTPTISPIDINAKIPQLSARLSSTDPSAISAIMTQDFQLLAGQMVELWQRFIALLPSIAAETETILRSLYERRMADRWKEAIFRETCTTNDVTQPSEKAVWETHQKIADHLRKSHHFLSLEPLPVTELFLLPAQEQQPILFEQRYISESSRSSSKLSTIGISSNKTDLLNKSIITELCRPLASTPKGYRGIHLFVLVHGFQGNSYDMRLLKNSISVSYPSAVFLCSAANEDDTEGSIETMGEKLADEVNRYIEEWSSSDTLSRLSFICHSLGGVIARTAFAHLQHLWPKFYTFFTLSSPHLGSMYNANKLVDAGMWVLKKWKKSQSLQQLTLSDSKTVRESFLFNLALKSQALGHFHHVCLISSYQDQYVPFESARMEISGKAESDARLGSIYTEMAQNATHFIRSEQLTRLDVNFKIVEKTLDTLIGRAAHIMFLENQILMRMLVQAYPHLFH